MNLEKEVQEAFEVIINNFGFTLKVLGVDELVLVKGSFALWFFYYIREGVSVSYLRKRDGKVQKYSLEGYLSFKRDWIVSSGDFTDDNVRKIRSLALTLAETASDILNGDEAWIADYKQHYSTMPLAQITANQIWKLDNTQP